MSHPRRPWSSPSSSSSTACSATTSPFSKSQAGNVRRANPKRAMSHVNRPSPASSTARRHEVQGRGSSRRRPGSHGHPMSSKGSHTSRVSPRRTARRTSWFRCWRHARSRARRHSRGPDRSAAPRSQNSSVSFSNFFRNAPRKSARIERSAEERERLKCIAAASRTPSPDFQ